MNNPICIIDDELDFLESARRGLFTRGFRNIRFENDPLKAVELFKQGDDFAIALIDITMSGMDGVELLGIIKTYSPNTECIMITAIDEARIAVECLKKGAYDYLVKPISRDDLSRVVSRALERKRLRDIMDLGKGGVIPKFNRKKAFKPIVTRSVQILRILKEAELHAVSDVPVLITGDSGTGKELLARAVHDASPRAKSSFLAVNMAALTTGIFDAEFFGHTKGAFTGATRDRIGYLEHSHHGTIFLDEIGTLSPDIQGKLLRVLQEGEYIKIGTSVTRKADVRFIAATNADLDSLIKKGLFRKDLYYRLKGAWLYLPPLKERKGDIPALTEKFLEEFGNFGGERIEDDAMAALMDYHYPGNIRELKAILQSAVNLSRGAAIRSGHLPEALRKRKPAFKHTPIAGEKSLVPLEEMEKTHILKVYEHTDRNKSRSARVLGIGLNTLRRKLASYGVK
jgi:two-component system response regulator AtoC